MTILIKKRLANTESPPATVKISGHHLDEVTNFFKECRARVGAELFKFLRNRYTEVFNEPCPKGVSYELIKLKIGYEIQIRGYRAAGITIPPNMLKNYEAALKCDRTGMSPILQVPLKDEYASRGSKDIAKHIREKKEEEMGKAKKVVRKEKGPTIDDIWVKILSAAVGKRLTDKAIAAQMEKACPGHKYNAAAVAAHRSGYNNGRFPSQKGVKPKTRLERYEK